MDISLIVRILPALLAAVGVAWLAARHTGVRFSAVVDAALEVAIVGVVAARLVWVAIDGLDAAMRAPTTVFLVRSGVETWAGVGVAVAWGLWRWGPDRLAWVRIAAPAAGLAGVAAWQAACEAENACAGIPATWGVALPGYLSPMVPAGYIEAVIVAVFALVAYRFRHRLDIGLGMLAVYALVRGGLGFLRSPLVTLPTRDQVLSAIAAAVFAALAVTVRRHRRQYRVRRGTTGGHRMAATPDVRPVGDLPNEIGKTAARELSGSGIDSLEKVAGHSEKELLAIHGVGPKAIRILGEALAAKGLRYKDPGR